MKSIIRPALALIVAMTLSASVLAREWQQGTHYEVLSSPVRTSVDQGIEVAEVFWYGCPHCYSFKPLVEKWSESLADDVDFVLLPAALGRAWEVHARAFYTLQAMDELERVHDDLFEALAGDRRPLNSPEALAEFLAGLGVDKQAFLDTYESFGVNAQFQKAQSKVRSARITGVPTMLVNGKYKVSASMAGGHEEVLEVVDFLIEKERQAAAD
ncbi:MAG TPA: disulfide bond formation protein DsbA [Marinobacter sp.]|jgi:thiol:disulfide interchange protein DsbA|uniref:thiol:disulfide interchange protein DsbA/DsbL n=1 Tax=Marinobacter sp. TaxID=50741 RepID=UPI000EBFD9F9|nr:thiol:disulfide interchange protein DsbA/DsbL [Marinobacter sp.]MBC7191279.1 thiol:disulfide interchange protein DsbA/DsbL [Marinobacter sp.]HCW89666.1 disulfide bond formation protein DsbA [Marinobacter sp.]